MKVSWIQSLFNRLTIKLEKRPLEDGDVHSGPDGYTPNAPYPETQYGSNFDEDAAWNEDER
jgi:hypothetical protein